MSAVVVVGRINRKHHLIGIWHIVATDPLVAYKATCGSVAYNVSYANRVAFYVIISESLHTYLI